MEQPARSQRYIPGIAVLLCVIAVAGCGSASEPAAAPSPEALARARRAADDLGAELMQRLTEQLIEGGPTAAIGVCSQAAQELARAHSGDGLTVRRVTLKVRNPADTPDAWERAKLEQLEAQQAAGELPPELAEVVEEGGLSRVRYMRPLIVLQPCLTCHGDAAAMDAEIVALLDELYPDDQARGYRYGQLRGAISVVVEQ